MLLGHLIFIISTWCHINLQVQIKNPSCLRVKLKILSTFTCREDTWSSPHALLVHFRFLFPSVNNMFTAFFLSCIYNVSLLKRNELTMLKRMKTFELFFMQNGKFFSIQIKKCTTENFSTHNNGSKHKKMATDYKKKNLSYH